MMLSLLNVIALLISLLAGFILYYTYDLGGFTKVSVEETTIGPFKIIYKEYKGSYAKMGPFFKRIRHTTKKYFKDIKFFAIYYDNPLKILKVNECRAVGGIIVPDNEADVQIYNQFMRKNLDFQSKILPKVQALKSSKFPYKNYLSFIFETLKVYPKMIDAFKTKFPNTSKLEKQKLKNGSMELYQLEGTEKYIEVYFPFGQKSEEYKLTTYNSPLKWYTQLKNEFKENWNKTKSDLKEKTEEIQANFNKKKNELKEEFKKTKQEIKANIEKRTQNFKQNIQSKF